MDLSDALEVVRLTDVGLLRDHNEDAIASDVTMGFVILADGMGGYKAGEVASEMAVLSITADLKEAMINDQSNLEAAGFKKQPESQLIIDAVKQVNEVIYHVSQTQSQCAGMGTTLVVGLFTNNKLLVGHIGDSRMYRLRGQVLTQITEDHSLLQEQIKLGLITPEQAKFSANRNLVTRALGTDPEVELELNEYDVALEDVYLLCSDGLSDMVDDSIIQAALNEHSFSLTKAVEVLVQLANDKGGKDNISVILVKVKKTFECNYSWYDNFLGWLK
ncbi:MAG: Stp1/IreP family PP2C-type Ser/Thr phosphatase [Methylotenera sp.]|nr:Stp1/IreP family PP2C-type Ser/Thr phosphatase [Methylotenera sp.]MDO9231992.1 Stp1/IreP family PP2C-type Ser/Thr phosphatase [Methylotenera sp.]MDO9389519.1 Stp1/IreP family PP2C-type Ser/Thr phosphatase [Methylotenera sp.]MDP2101477.1 Stp1/IreP family PP2C-type Ser/Thr phosphatase [Methylotenera sp.]MDP2280413.1 Stp1/IreP family PP2C-type Ser/Thr phosphatase [Methylotenera sp.]